MNLPPVYVSNPTLYRACAAYIERAFNLIIRLFKKKCISLVVMEEQHTFDDLYQEAIQHFYCEIQVSGALCNVDVVNRLIV